MKTMMAKTIEIQEQNSVFIDMFGDTPMNRVLDFLVIGDGFDHSMTDIADCAEVGYATLKLLWPALVKNNFVKQTRRVGKAKMYNLNYDNPIVKRFKRFYWDVTHEYVRQDLARQGIKLDA